MSRTDCRKPVPLPCLRESKFHSLAVSAICTAKLASFVVRAQKVAGVIDCRARQDGRRAHQVRVANPLML